MTISEGTLLLIGLIGTIASIVLALVAIAFAYVVDRRSKAVSDQTIRSLQKIESEVERSSEDTRSLIKAGWDKMLGSVTSPMAAQSEAKQVAEQVAAGLVQELRADLLTSLDDDIPTVAQSQVDRLDELLQRLEDSVQSQMRGAATVRKPSEALESTLAILQHLSSMTLALVDGISTAHITAEQYKALMDGGVLSEPLRELRTSGLLVPLVGESRQRGPILVYWFPPGRSRSILAALPLVEGVRDDLRTIVGRELERVGSSPVQSDDVVSGA